MSTSASEVASVDSHPRVGGRSDEVELAAMLGQFRIKSGRVVTRYVGSGIEGVGSGIRRVGSGITALEPGIIDHGIGISSFFRDHIRDRNVPYWWDQGRKLVTLLETRIRNLRTKNGFSDEKTYLVTTLIKWLKSQH